MRLGLDEPREQLVELLRRTGRGERIVVGPEDSDPVVSGPATRSRSHRRLPVVAATAVIAPPAEVMAKDRGADTEGDALPRGG